MPSEGDVTRAARSGVLAAGVACALAALPIAPAGAQTGDTSHHGDLAQQLQNPISNIISLPFQSNLDFRGGPRNDGFSYTLNFQPVIPFQLGADWTLITRTIVPLRYTERISPDHEFGLGDASASFFFSPRSGVQGLTYGFGPTVLLPTATRPAFEARQFGLGPTGVLVQALGPWTVGGLASHTWGVADAGSRQGRPAVNQTFLQPFVGYNFGRGLTANIQMEASYDWTDRQ